MPSSAGAPMVSVLLPSCNGEATLEEAIESALGQSYRRFELVAVDDGSSDRSLEILESFAARYPQRIRVYTHAGHVNRGLIATYALALSKAEGSVIAFLEADDVWHSDNLARKVRPFDEHAEVGVVHADYEPFGARRAALYWGLYGWGTRVSLPVGRPYSAFAALLLRNPIPSFTHFIVRRELLEAVPPLRMQWRNCDWWTLAHLSCSTKFYFIPQKLTRWRIHKTSSHYGPVRLPLRELREYLLSLHDSLLASPEVQARQELRLQVESARRLTARVQPRMLEDRRSLLASMRETPFTSICVLADAALRRLLLS